MEIQSHLNGVKTEGVHAVPCIPVYEMWRCEFTTFDESAGEQGRCIVADGSFAIGSGNVNGLPREVDVFQEQADPFQAGLDHGHCGRLW